jgi:hypothetical protein
MLLFHPCKGPSGPNPCHASQVPPEDREQVHWQEQELQNGHNSNFGRNTTSGSEFKLDHRFRPIYSGLHSSLV